MRIAAAVGLLLALAGPPAVAAWSVWLWPRVSPVAASLVDQAMLWALALSILSLTVLWERLPLRSIGLVRVTWSIQAQSGISIAFKQNLRSKDLPKHIGEKLEVAYLPNDPKRAELVEFIWLAPALLTLWGVLLSVFGYLIHSGRMVVGPLRKRGLTIGG